MKRDYRIVENLQEMNKVLQRGLLAITEDGSLLSRCESVDVLIESSNSISAGGQFAANALEYGQHLVMMNTEADLIFGPYLLHLARKNGRVYTSGPSNK